MKHLWRKIAIIMMIVFCLVGIAMTIVDTVRAGKIYNGGYAFTTFLSEFVRVLSLTALWGLLIEFSKNVEDWLEKIFRNNAGLEQLPDTPDFITAGINKIASAANSASVQQPYAQQPAPAAQSAPMPAPAPQPAPVAQPAPMPTSQAAPVAQPAPMPTPQAAPVPQPVPAPQPAPAAQPAPAPTSQQSDGWTCSCGTSNVAAANFCRACGKPRS